LVTYTFSSARALGFGLELAVDGAGAAGELDEPVPLDRALPSDSLLGFSDLLIDPAPGPPGPVSLVLVVEPAGLAPTAFGGYASPGPGVHVEMVLRLSSPPSPPRIALVYG
jgi:hypothetical protein